MKKLISYILPVFNESENIELLYSEILKSISSYIDKYSFEFIYTNDCSSDDSLNKLIQLSKKDPRVIVIDLARRTHHQMAVTAAIDYANGDAVIIMDSDLQDPPSVSIELINKWEDGYDVVYAQRRKRKDSFFKKVTAFLFYRILDSLSDVKIPKDTGDFRLMDRKVVTELMKFKEHNRFLRGMIASLGFKQVAVLFDRNERKAGKSGYSVTKMFKFAFDGITGFSLTPLKLIAPIGFTILFIGKIFIIVSILAKWQLWLIGMSYAHLLIIGLIIALAGLILLVLGIISEYLGRIYIEVLDRPLYVINKIYGKRKASPLAPLPLGEGKRILS